MAEPKCPECFGRLEVLEDLEERLLRCKKCGVEYSPDELRFSWDENNIDELHNR